MMTDGTQYLILDQVNGWREYSPTDAREGLALTAEGNRQLFALPGRSSLLLDTTLQEGRFVCPSAVSINSDVKVGVVDATTARVSLVDLDRGSIETISTFGGKGRSARNFLEPRGIALLKSGGIVVCDTGNHRVQMFSETQQALVQSWGAVDQTGSPIPGDGQKAFHFPWAIEADDCGAVFIVDRRNHRIQKIFRDGTWLGEIGRDCLLDPTRIALGPGGLVAVVDQQQQAVFIFSPRRALPRALTNIEDVRSLTFTGDGTLYVADASGLINVYVPAAENKEKYNSIGQSHSGVEGEIVDLAWVPGASPFLLAIIKENFNGLRQRLWRIEPLGTFRHEGHFVTSALDSKLEKCQWHRVLLSASMPSDGSQPGDSLPTPGQLGAGSIEIDSYTSDVPHDATWTPAEENWTRCVLSGDDNPDCLVQSGPGRFLWLRITLRSNGIASPLVKSIKAFFPRLSYLQYLPAVYQEDDESRLFLERFLSIFQTQFDDFDQKIDKIWQLFDPWSISESQFDWLAGWVALVIEPDSLIDDRCRFECLTEQKCQPPPECPPVGAQDLQVASENKPPLGWSSAKKRQMLADAFSSYRQRGTVPGIERLIQDYTGVHFAKILEHFRLRRWPVLSVVASQDRSTELDPCVPDNQPSTKGACGEDINTYKVTLPLDGTVRLWSRDFYKRLQLTSYSQIGYFRLTGTPEPAIEPFDWGANRFTVFFPSSPYKVAETRQKVQQVVEREKPAHTQAELCPVFPRLRVGVQATIGADAVVGGISHLVLNTLSTLNYDSILACSVEEERLRARGTGRRLRTGITTKLA